ncbi:hypothetical protein B0J14DRAFT_561869 [Halenospora varia]|nr:hypothetical protein B0J14DRAFT_561869 [Halenospora varia]
MLYEQEVQEDLWRLRTSQLSISFIILRTLQLIIGFITLVLTGYIITVFNGDTFHSFALTFISFTWTFFFMIYIFVTPLWLPTFYHLWTHLGLEIVAFSLWLSDFSLLAWEIMLGDDTLAIYSLGFDPTLAASAAQPRTKVAVRCGKAAAVLSLLNWTLLAATVIISAVAA